MIVADLITTKADVIAFFFILIIVMADVIAMYEIVADVITTEADVIAFLFMVLADVIANHM